MSNIDTLLSCLQMLLLGAVGDRRKESKQISTYIICKMVVRAMENNKQAKDNREQLRWVGLCFI